MTTVEQAIATHYIAGLHFWTRRTDTTVDVGEDERSRYLVDALNAHWAAGHRPGEPT